jgi:class 3 adenylate cyclase
MKSVSDLTAAIKEILATKWERRSGTKIPTTEDVKLGNDAVELEGTVLYADLAESTAFVNNLKDSVAAEIYKVYLYSACELIRNNGGEITAFDGDRVMAVFIGDEKESLAAKCALQVNWIVTKVINPLIGDAYPKLSYTMRQAVGIDSSKLFIARTGIRGSNDLVWVGRAANYAAKLSALRDGNYASFLTADVFSKLSKQVKFGGSPEQLMWTKFSWTDMGIDAYKSTWRWSPDE